MRQVAIATPAEQQQRNVEQQRGRQHPIDRAAGPRQQPDRIRHHIAGQPDEQQDRRDHDAAGHHVTADR